MHLPDPIEQLEARQERQAERAEYDDATGTMLCSDCENRFPVSELSPIDARPDAPFVCECCLDVHYHNGPKPT